VPLPYNHFLFLKAIYFALMLNLRVVYTTPLKALSNQKFHDFTSRFGGDRVGLVTGDVTINRNAQILIMTTEVFRNIIYDENERLSNLFMVYLRSRFEFDINSKYVGLF
jgi:ATP-dependent RNA helicase HelY